MSKSFESMDLTDENEKLAPTSAETDSVFEPTIEELVNDFDDEQTLREEEALAELENSQNPLDEIDALKEEGEMPLEELLAKYAMPALHAEAGGSGSRRKKKKSSKKNKTKSKQNSKSFSEAPEKTKTTEIISKGNENGEITECIIIDSDDDDDIGGKAQSIIEIPEDTVSEILPEENDNFVDVEANNSDKLKIRRSHLFELYPDQNFDDAIAAHGGELEALYSEDDEFDDFEEEEENDPDYIKKTIMVGSAFQAVIPGLSQYGDVLPYENEDKLVWEPSQVSEAEVEEYLLKIRDIKPTLNEEDTMFDSEKNGLDSEISNDLDAKAMNSSILNDESEEADKDDFQMSSSSLNYDSDVGGVVKDNEQALHLLVQCGYDFKEALRRKRLNAVPLTGGTMSSWSEEECKKFEEGIQKYGKDFLKIRQNQVRTRTMRELVQFYYLWKKSERRDHNFANADTVDHMDIYLNEGEDYSTSPNSLTLTNSMTALGRKMNGHNQNNFSIMTGSSQSGTSSTKVNNGNLSKRKRTQSGSNALYNNHHSGNSKNMGDKNNDNILSTSSGSGQKK